MSKTSISGFGYCVWLLIKNPDMFNNSRILYSNCIINYPLHVTVRTDFDTYESALNYATKFKTPNKIVPYKLVNKTSNKIDNDTFNALEIAVDAGSIKDAHISLAYTINRDLPPIKVELYEHLPSNKKTIEFELCIADLRKINPEEWIIIPIKDK